MILNGLKKRLREDTEVTNAISGGLAGAITATVVCPLDVLKTRLQVQGKAAMRYTGIGGGLSMIMREEGVRGLYRGLSPTLFALLPNWAVYFSTYERLKVAIGARVNPSWSQSPAVHMAAAAGAGAATMLITNPLWVIKTRLQTQNMGIRMGKATSPALYKGTVDAFIRIAREEGMAGLYSGLGPSLLGVMHVVIQFPLYESMKQYFNREHLARQRRALGAAAPDAASQADRLNLPELVLASAASKMVASTATYPHEVVRSRMHVAGTGAFSGFMRTCHQIYREDQIAGFYRGCMTNLVRTTPAAAVTFTSFELINRALREWASADSGAEEQQRMQQQQAADARREEESAKRQQQQHLGQPRQQHGVLATALQAPFAAASASVDLKRLDAHTRDFEQRK